MSIPDATGPLLPLAISFSKQSSVRAPLWTKTQTQHRRSMMPRPKINDAEKEDSHREAIFCGEYSDEVL
jgi:hypothetical protein